MLCVPKTATIQFTGPFQEECKEARRNGKFQDVNFLETNISGYHLEYVYRNKNAEKRKEIYVDKKLKDKITVYKEK